MVADLPHLGWAVEHHPSYPAELSWRRRSRQGRPVLGFGHDVAWTRFRRAWGDLHARKSNVTRLLNRRDPRAHEPAKGLREVVRYNEALEKRRRIARRGGA